MRKPQFPKVVIDQIPDAVSRRLHGKKSRRVTGRRVAIGGSVFAVLAVLVTAGTGVAKKRYETGTAKVTQIIDHADGAIVILDNNSVFWASADTRRVLDTYTGDDAPLLSYRIDRLRRHISGLMTGRVTES